MSNIIRFITADEAISLLPEKGMIHTFIDEGLMIVGADWTRQSVIDELKMVDKIEIAGEGARSMGHGIVAYYNSAKYQSDLLFIETDKDKHDEFDKPQSTHELKILPKWFEDVQNGIKNFEIRRNDRDFKVGDFLMLKEWHKGRFTGRAVVRQIEYIYVGDGTYGLSDEYCVLGLKNERR